MTTTVEAEPAKAIINNQEEVTTTSNAVEIVSEEPKEEVPETLAESEVKEVVEEVKLMMESKDVGQRNEETATSGIPELVAKESAKVASEVEKKSTEEEEEPKPEPRPETKLEVSNVELEEKEKLVETEEKIGKEVPQVNA